MTGDVLEKLTTYIDASKKAKVWVFMLGAALSRLTENQDSKFQNGKLGVIDILLKGKMSRKK